MLEINDLTIDIGSKRVVDNVSFELFSNRVLALVGESGSGKTMTALSILDLLPRTAKRGNGKILFKNTDIFCLTPDEKRKLRGNRIAMVFQEPFSALNPVICIGEQLKEALSTHKKWSKSKIIQHIKELLIQVQLSPDVVNSYAHELSGGMCQRVILAMALACDPEVLILDEPTTALDALMQREILNLIKNIQMERHIAILFITHDFSIVNEIADEVCEIKNGKIIKQDNKNAKIGMWAPCAGQSVSYHYEAALPHVILRPLFGRRISILEVKNIKKYFSKKKKLIRAVDDVSFTVGKGETFGLVGESACGKTTIAKLITGILKADSGEIFVPKNIDIVFQDPISSLNPRMKVKEIIGECLLIRGIKQKEIDLRVAEALNIVKLDPVDSINKYPHQFSGGERQRIAIARALIRRPELVVLDEPVSNLDISIQAGILNLLKELQKTRGLTYIFISHDLSVVEFMSDMVGVMKDGKLVEIASRDEIYTSPKTEYTRSLLSASRYRTRR